MKKAFTTSEVGKMLQVSRATVARWFDSGSLRGYRYPGTGDRRIPRDCLYRFCREYGLSVTWHELGEAELDTMEG